jgi:transposase, IS5 family
LRALGPAVIEQLHRQVVDVAKRAGVTHGRRFASTPRSHYPTDSTLLQDSVRVLTRTMRRASAALGDQPGRIRNRLRSVTRAVLMIGYQARSPKTRDAMVQSYRKLMATTRAVLRDADTMIRRLGHRRRTATAATTSVLQRANQALRQMRPLVERVVAQTRSRLLGGDTHVADKVLSLFQPHTTTIRKGKISKPNEFGNLATIQEAEHQIITAYEVHAGRPADVTLWTPALDRHHTIFHRAPYLAAGDRGFSSAANDQAATARGVRRVILPRRGPKSPARRVYERQAWFRRGQRWRMGCEGRISVIKRRHGLRRCHYHGTDGMARWVGLGVIADNLLNTALFSKARAAA